MKITVLNGSPKGDISVTMQYVNYIKNKCGEGASYQIFNISKDIGKIEKNKNYLLEIVSHISSSDAVIWAFPVYVFLVPAQLKRFIELIFENGLSNRFSGKYATSITTSVHFFDTTAHDYIAAVSEDLGMNYSDGYSAEMMELADNADSPGRLISFANEFINDARKKAPRTLRFDAMPDHRFKYEPEISPDRKTTKETGKSNISDDPAIAPGTGPSSKISGKLLILTDEFGTGSNISKMIETVSNAFPGGTEIVNLSESDIKSPCIGCMTCAYESICVFKDDIRKIVADKIQTADAIVFAGAVRDRYLSSLWKTFFDRCFYRGHISLYDQKPVGFIVSGALRKLPWLRQIFEGMANLEDSALAGIVTDECADSSELSAQLSHLAEKLAYAVEKGTRGKNTFYSEGGRLIFREMVYRTWPLFRMDHKHYSANGYYDFPQKRYSERLTNAFYGLLMLVPSIRKYMYRNMKTLMLRPFEKINKIKK